MVISMHYITLFVIDIDNIRCLEPFLPLYDHFEIRRFLGINWQYYLKLHPKLLQPRQGWVELAWTDGRQVFTQVLDLDDDNTKN